LVLLGFIKPFILFAPNFGAIWKAPEIVKVPIFKLLSHHILIYLPTVRHWVEMLKFSYETILPHKNKAATTQAQLYSSRSQGSWGQR
jgi:hypothetical protein